ncbi:hypothetical protein OOK29_25800 [Streptomyces phaeochromogenes]|uniref:hypothetical protein n=1 Tax=Streptomyces phaeochromogenes TaxID=1923 RepID=UPI00225BC2AC|nr:hypothetical protein [Streptomyces phaeochromogenes]MCX5601568.1 hypothetical protein [Streptomyces phaeochromogenes]
MAPNPEQMPSRTCGCRECLIDYPPQDYGERPPQDACQGKWRVRWRDGNGKQRQKLFPSCREADGFLEQLRGRYGA